MSRLSTRLSPAWLAPRVQVGISIHRDRVDAAVLTQNPQPTIISAASAQLVQPWFVGKVTPTVIAELSSALKLLLAPIDGVATINLSLPDPLGSYAVFEFDVIPKTAEALNDLVRWRFAKELHHDESTIVCRSQRLTVGNAVFGVALDRQWFAAVVQAAEDANVLIAKVDTGVGYRFNRFYSQLVSAALREGGILAIERDSWGVTLWDAHGQIRFARARWRSDADRDTIVTEAARLIRASRGLVASQPLTLYVACPEGEDVVALIAAVQARTGERCEALNVNEGLMIAAGVSPINNPGAINAAMHNET